jgi:hypothetical protein
MNALTKTNPKAINSQPPPEDWADLAAAGRIADAIMAYVAAYDWVSFAELSRKLEAHMDVRGDIALEMALMPNVIVWAGMSQEFFAVFKDLLEAKRLHLHPAHVLTYMVDGGTLDLPLAKRPPPDGYKEPHWLPACLRIVPLAN